MAVRKVVGRVFAVICICFGIRLGNGSSAKCGDSEECKIREALGLFAPDERCLKQCLPRVPLPVHVNVYVSYTQVIQLDEAAQMLTMHVYIGEQWNSSLTWDPALYGGRQELVEEQHVIWVPDAMIYSAVKVENVHKDVMVYMNSNGIAFIVHQFTIVLPCKMDTFYFPFDKQQCEVTIGSWVYSDKYVKTVLHPLAHEKMNDSLVPNPVWDIYQMNVEESQELYGQENDSYSHIIYTLKMQRQAAFFAFVLILPAVMLSFLMLAVFCLPPEFGDKQSITLGIFLSYFVLLMILVESVPTAGASIPVLGQYYAMSLILIGLSVLCSSIVINMHDRGRLKSYRFPKNYIGLLLKLAAVLKIKHQMRGTKRVQTIEVTEVTNYKQNGGILVGHDASSSEEEPWVILAQVLDRLFFILFLFLNVISASIMYFRFSSV